MKFKKFTTGFLILVLSVFIFSCENESDTSDTISPTVVTMVPANGATNVSSLLTEIKVTFSEPMASGYSVVTVTGGTWFPTYGAPSWSTDKLTFTLPVTVAANTTYTFGLNNTVYINFRDSSGNALTPVVWIFTTGN
jgi:hypothetical protein